MIYNFLLLFTLLSVKLFAANAANLGEANGRITRHVSYQYYKQSRIYETRFCFWTEQLLDCYCVSEFRKQNRQSEALKIKYKINNKDMDDTTNSHRLPKNPEKEFILLDRMYVEKNYDAELD